MSFDMTSPLVDKEKCARMSNNSFIQELDQAAAVLDDELKAISEVENANISLCKEEVSFFQDDDDDDDLTGELANLNSLTALQQELNMSALSFEEFNANNLSKASTHHPEGVVSALIEEEDAVITDVGEIQIGDALMLDGDEGACALTPWKPAKSSSVGVHRVVSNVDGQANGIQTLPSNDSEDSSVFQTTSSQDGDMHLLNQDRLDIALSPIRFQHASEPQERKQVTLFTPQSTRKASIKTPAREIFVDTTKSSVNSVHFEQEPMEDATPKIQNTRSASTPFQFQDDDKETSSDYQDFKATPKIIDEAAQSPVPQSSDATRQAPEPSPMSLLNTLLASPEPFFARAVSEEEPPAAQALATSDSEVSNDVGEMHSFSSQASSEQASVLSASADSSSMSVSSSTSKSSTQSTDSKKKWNPTRLFKNKNNNSSSEEGQRKSIFSKSNSKKKKSKIRLRSSPAPASVLPTVSEDTTLPSTQANAASPKNITVAPPHDPSEDQIRENLGMQQEGNTNAARQDSLFSDNKERVAVNRMMKMLMEQRKKNKTQERRERKLLHMLCDARNDRMQLINEHKKEFEELERKMRSSFENNEILRQENELLIMQTEAWKEISRQSNQTAALYKYTFDERQGQPVYYQAPSVETMDDRSVETAQIQGSVKEEYERKLADTKKEYEELEEKLQQFQKESHLELEDAKYQVTWLKRELEQSQSIFESKLEAYIEENVQLKLETATLQKQLEQSQKLVTSTRNEIQDLQNKLDSPRSKIFSEISNSRIQKLEDQLVQVQDSHQTTLTDSNLDMTILQARIKDLETALCESNVLQSNTENDLKAVQDQLSSERRSRGTSTRIFQQQNESLMQENQYLQQNVKQLEAELDQTRNDQRQLEDELVQKRKDVHRLEKQSEDEADLIKDLQEELDSLQIKLDEAESKQQAIPAPSKSVRSPEFERTETQGTLEQEILAAENVSLRAQVERLKMEMRSSKPPPSTPKSVSYPSTYRSPVEKRVRDQVLRLRSSLSHKQDGEGAVPPPPASPFFSETSPSLTLTGNLKSQNSTTPRTSSTPKNFVSMLRPKSSSKGPSMQPRRLDKENNATFLSPSQPRNRKIGLSTRTGLGIR